MEINVAKVEWTHAATVAAEEFYPGVRKRCLWTDGRAKALIVEIDPGAKFLELDVHAPGPEEVYVLEGVFHDGLREYPAGTFLHHPAGSSHVPQSRSGCKLLVFFPEG